MTPRTAAAMTRRAFGAGAGAVAAAGGLAKGTTLPGPFIVTTWHFGASANAVGWPVLSGGGSALDAVEAAINHVELLDDEPTVGWNGMPNTDGETTLDAMVMWGPTHEVGAVGCLKRVKRAVSVARKVLELTQHSLLVGEDATRFALDHGFAEESLIGEASRQTWEEWRASGKGPPALNPEPIFRSSDVGGHDTVGTIARDAVGNLCIGCSTNGRNLKLPGRVGDSPIAGAGAYVDQAVGAATATGNGDVMMRFLPSFHAVELMRAGMDPGEAARAALARISAAGYRIDGGIVTVRADGAHGAAKLGWGDVPFAYSVTNANGSLTFPVA